MDTYNIGNSITEVYLNDNFSRLESIVSKESAILLVDGNVYNLHPEKFAAWKCIVVKPGESSKQQSTINDIIGQLIAYEADRSSWLVGIGGGVLTDITGYVASIYMRGIKFGFIP